MKTKEKKKKDERSKIVREKEKIEVLFFWGKIRLFGQKEREREIDADTFFLVVVVVVAFEGFEDR